MVTVPLAVLNPAVLPALQRHAAEFQRARPFRHVVIDDFLEPEVAHRLLQTFPGFDSRYALNEMGQVGGKAVREHVRELPAPYPELDRYIQSAGFLDAVSRLTGIPDLLYDPDYVGGGTHENVDGQSLDMHVDFNYHPRDMSHRRLNLIVYLNPEWEESWGGCIELAKDPWDPRDEARARVAPLFNRALVFETNEHSWHGFPRIQLPQDRKHLSRRSFAIYLYTRERPAGETAPSHGTVYVPGARPTRIGEGHTLTAADVAELDTRFAGARGQLRYMYDREKDLSQQIANLRHALDEARGAARLDLLGYARQCGAPQGAWTDGWASRQVAFTLEADSAITGISVRLWLPDAITGGATVRLAAAGREATATARPGRMLDLSLATRVPRGERVAVTLDSDRDWQPAPDGQGDDRRLAFRLVEVRLRH